MIQIAKRYWGSIFFCCSFLFYATEFLAFACDQFTLEKKLRARQSKVYLFKKKDGSLWVLKQRKESSVHDKFVTVLDAMGAFIAQSLGVPSNHVELVPAHEGAHCKPRKRDPATLHSFMGGQKIKYTDRFATMSVHQRFRKTDDDEKGLTLAVIKNMASHPDLPALVAVDTFIGNTDRNRLNILYDEENDRLHAIDFGDTFTRDLSQQARKSIHRIKHLSIKLSIEEINALHVYYKTLQKLITKYPGPKLVSLLNHYMTLAGCFKHVSSHDKDELKKEVSTHLKFIKKNSGSTKKLIIEIADLLEHQKALTHHRLPRD